MRPVFPSTWYGEVSLLGFTDCLDVRELSRLIAAGEFDFWALKGEPARCEDGSVVVEYRFVSGLGSVTADEPYPLPREVLKEPREGEMLLP